MGNRFAILDMPKELTVIKELLEYRGMIDSTYAAMYHPWLQVYDRMLKKPDFIPPSASVAGVYAKTDVNRGVHKAPQTKPYRVRGLRQIIHQVNRTCLIRRELILYEP